MVLNWINKRFGIRLKFDVYVYFQNRIQFFYNFNSSYSSAATKCYPGFTSKN